MNLRNCVANFVLLTSSSNKKISDQKPSQYLPNILADLGDDANVVLKSNLISDAALNAALDDDYTAFLNARADTLQNKALDLCAWKSLTTPGL